MDRVNLEGRVLRGQQASACLSFFDGFEGEMQARLWKSVRQTGELDDGLRCVALTTESFRQFLQGVVSDGVIAEKDLKEMDKNG